MSAASRAVFLLDQCIVPNENGIVQAWFTPLLFDAAYLHAICLATQSYFDSFRVRRIPQARQEEYLSFSKAIAVLQWRLARNDSKELLADSTIMTVWALSGYVTIFCAFNFDSLEVAMRIRKANIKLRVNTTLRCSSLSV